MQMQVSDQIIAVLDNLCQKIGVVFDWGSENVIPYVQDFLERYIKYILINRWFWAIFWTIIGATSALAFFYQYKNKDKHLDRWGTIADGWAVLMIGTGIVVAVSLIGFLSMWGTAIFTTIKAVTVPELFLLDEFKILAASGG